MEKERNLGEVKKNKAEIFSDRDAFDWDQYEAFLGNLESISNIQESEQREREFVKIWDKTLENLTNPALEVNLNERQTAAMMMVNLFESSFKFFSKDTADDVKERIANAQLEFMLNPKIKNEELKNVCKGMWGYYASPEKYYARKDIMAKPKLSEDEEYSSRRQEFRSALRSLSNDEMKSPTQRPTPSEIKRMFYLGLVESGTLRFEGFENEAENMRYFADLYASDIGPLAPIEANQGLGGSVGGGDRLKLLESHFETGVQMPSHTRFMNFGRNKLPGDETVDAGRSQIFISKDQRVSSDPEESKKVIRGREKNKITVDILPLQFLIHYIQRMRPVRFTDDYRLGSDAEKTELRLKAVKRFVDDLLDFNSGLWQRLDEDFKDQPDLLKKIKDQVSTYDSAACNVAFLIEINF